MKKAGMFIVLFLLCAGCTYEGRKLSEYIEEPQTIIKDPQFETYQEKRDALEKQYLRKKITYAEYVEKTEELDAAYSKEVQKREDIIAPQY